MTDISDRLSKLSPEQRELLRKKLQKQGKQSVSRETITRRPDPNSYPLSFSQQRLWFLHHLQPESPFYNIPSAIRLRGTIDALLLEKSISAIIRRHEILRSYFLTDEHGEPQQHIAPADSLPLTIADLTSFERSKREKEVAERLKAEASKPFNLEQFPLLRAVLFRIEKEDHILFINMHHIITDGWSLGIFVRELLSIYAALQQGTTIPLPEPALQFADYAHWQIERASKQLLEQQLQYWKNYLLGMPDRLELISDGPRPPIQTFKGKHFHFSIDDDLTERLRNLSRQLKISLFSLLMAAFQVFLHKISGQEDFGVGAPIANRHRRETEEIIGFFVNTIVLRARFDKDLSFLDFAQRVSKDIASASDNQDVPFEKIVESVQKEHELSYSPLFQVMFDLQPLPFKELKSNGFSLEIAEIEIEVAKFDLLLLLTDDSQTLQAIFEYNTDLFREETIARFSHYFTTLLRHIIQHPEHPISSLSLIDEQEKAALLTQWNNTRRPYPSEKAVNAIFEEVAEKFPNETALEFDDITLTFAELNRKANRFARVLIDHGVTGDDAVALYMERTADMFVAILAILKAGGYYVPLDTAYPRDRLLFMLEDSGARLLISEEAQLSKIDSEQINILTIENLRLAAQDHNEDHLPVKNNGDSPAYIIYTSGSTGKPKGVIVPHRAISRLVINTDYIHLQPGERIAQISNATFDAATLEIWGAFLTGATLVGFEKNLVLSIRPFARSLIEKRITVLFLTTALFNQMALDIPNAFRNLHYLMTGGDAADVHAFRKVLNSNPPRHLLHVYGPTENTTFSTWYEVKEIPENAVTIPIGKPIANSFHYIVDKYNQPVPVGVPGELLLGGDGLALGYHDRPELNRERFINNPFAKTGRLYHSGDLVRYQADGNVVFIGRIDKQVKIRGFRVELGEIEIFLRDNPQVKDCAVIARDDLPGAKQLVAYIVPADDKIDPDQLRQYLSRKLPDYMIPSAMVQMDKLPITPNGKLDRQALPKPQMQRSLSKAYTAPRNPLEEYLTQIWREILKIDKVGIYDNFFELGGNSLQAAVFSNRLQKEFNTEVHVAGIFKAPCIADFAAYVFEYYPDVVKKRFGNGIQSDYGVTLHLDETVVKKLQKQDFEQFATLIKKLPDYPRDQKKNPRAVFVLSPPRSGSTLLRIMLAGNKKLFSPPELDLLSFNTLGERYAEFSRDGLEIWLESPIRALMEIFHLDFDSARQMMREKEQADWSVKSFYRLLQENIGDRLLVDKTPTYPFDLNVLQRAEEDFEEPLYIHLLRHPYAMIYSFIEAKLDQNFFRYEHSYTRRELAELIWHLSHRNILEFARHIPAGRYYRVKFEDILLDPRNQLQALCDFLQIDFDEEMLKPYQGQKMTDAARKNSQMVGDFKFYLHRNINTKVIDRWREFHKENFLSDNSWELAAELGYEVEKNVTQKLSVSLSKIPKIPRTEPLPLSYAQQRLWFLEQMVPGSAQYNIPVAVHMKGKLEEEPFQKTLNRIFERHESLRTVFQTRDGMAYQYIYPDPRSETRVDYLYGVSPDDPKIKQIITEESKKPFNIESGPLVHFRYLILAEDELIMIMVIHHIISDGWSMGIFFKEFAVLYDHYLNQSALDLPELPIQYADYAAWQRDWLQARILQKQLGYWRDKLAGAPERLALPTDRPHPPAKTYNGKRINFRLDRQLSDNVKAFVREKNSTLFNVMLTAYQILLARYSGQNDILIGIPNAYRNREEIEHLIGFFVNTLVIRTQINSGSNFNDLIGQVQQNLIEAFDNQDIPFEKLVDELDPKRNMSHTPLFQVMFSLQPQSVNLIEIPGLSIVPIPTDTETAKFDMNLTLLERYDTIIGEWEYNTDLFDEATINRYIRHYIRLLEHLIAHPDQNVFYLPLLAPEEEREIIHCLDRGVLPVASQKVLPQLFEEQAARGPDHPAAEDADRQISYGELNRRANQLAHYLIAHGVRPDDMIGLVANRRVEALIGLMAIWKAGAAYLPIDPFYPRERIDYILQDAQAKFIVNPDSSDLDLSRTTCPVLNLDTMHDQLDKQPANNPCPAVDAQNLAYVIYTSGSTGKPKGVMLEHGNVLHLLANMKKQIYDTLPGDRFRLSLNAPFAFDASVEQIIMLAAGHTLIFIPQDIRNDGEALRAYIEEKRIDILDCVPSQLKLLVAAGLFTSPVWKPRVIMPGGEAIDQTLWQTMAGQKDMAFYNLYGPTECTVNSTIFRIADPTSQPLIGPPVYNLRFYILDQNLHIVPAGVCGELYISGLGLARGYVGHADLTAEKFLPDPFSDQPVTRMYRSGDLVSMQPDGNLKFHGRIDHQVKVRGFRIELGEIENILKQHPVIDDAVVIVREDKPGLRQISAYYTLKAQATAETKELREHLQAHLPDYMIPVFYIELAELPLLPNGKIDRNKLPKPDSLTIARSAELKKASTEKEQILADIWSELLNLQIVGIDDNFFELGGDSILSIQMIARARQRGLQITPRQLFENPTIEKLAVVAGSVPLIHAEQGMVHGALILTPIQRHFFEQNHKKPQHWNQSIMLEVLNPLDPQILQQVVAAILNQHDALRLRFKAENGQWQAEHAETPDDGVFVCHDLSRLPATEQVLAIEKEANRLQVSLNLEKGPLLRVAYFKCGSGQSDRLLLIVHHLVVDGISWRILTEDIQTAYTQAAAGQHIQLPPKTTSFLYWTKQLAEYAKSPALKEEADFWLKQNIGSNLLPRDHERGPNNEASTGTVLITLNQKSTLDLLQKVPGVFNTQINDALLTALVQAMEHWSGEKELWIQLEGHGREDIIEGVDISRTVGWFTTLYPVKLDIRGALNSADALRKIKEQLRRIPQKGIGFGLLRYLSDDPEIREQLRSIPTPELVFNYLGQFDQIVNENSPFKPLSEGMGLERSPDSLREHLLEVSASVRNGELNVVFTFSKNYHNEETINRLAQDYLSEIRNLMAFCASPNAGGYTPSDFEEAGLEEDEIDDLLAELDED